MKKLSANKGLLMHCGGVGDRNYRHISQTWIYQRFYYLLGSVYGWLFHPQIFMSRELTHAKLSLSLNCFKEKISSQKPYFFLSSIQVIPEKQILRPSSVMLTSGFICYYTVEKVILAAFFYSLCASSSIGRAVAS